MRDSLNHTAFIARQQTIARGARIDLDAYCKCGHKRREHHPNMGCMNFDVNRDGSGWCRCECMQVRAAIA